MNHSSDTDFITQAIDLAQENSRSGENGPFGALVVKDGKVIGRGENRVVASCDPSAHAEIVAIREAGRALGSHDLTGCTIYSSCEPCPMCLSALVMNGIQAVYSGPALTVLSTPATATTLRRPGLTTQFSTRRLPGIGNSVQSDQSRLARSKVNRSLTIGVS